MTGNTGAKGEDGAPGEKGADGTSVKILGTKDSVSSLPATGNSVGRRLACGMVTSTTVDWGPRGQNVGRYPWTPGSKG